MSAYHIQRKIRIDATQNRVNAAIRDFNEWPKWSPWLCMEKNVDLKYQGQPGKPGHGYQWEGKMVGAGGMEMTSTSDENHEMLLTFLKPFKSRANVIMNVIAVGEDETDVTWHMHGKLPFFMCFMLITMKAMIGSDYDRGLKMLKDYVETGDVQSDIELVGVVETDPFSYVGVNASCSIGDIGESMNSLMEASMELIETEKLIVSGPPGAVYHDVDFVEQKCRYILMNQVDSVEGIKNGEIGSVSRVKAIKVIHKGSYRHLGNAWSAAMSYLRYQKLKPYKTESPFELYLNDPNDTDDGDLITEIFVPIR